jgi:hypothetical protein
MSTQFREKDKTSLSEMVLIVAYIGCANFGIVFNGILTKEPQNFTKSI